MSIKVGLLGAVLNDGNLGCVALTYSLLALLEKIRINNELKLEYLIFEGTVNNEKLELAANSLMINRELIKSSNIRTTWPVITRLHHFREASATLSQLKACDIVIDLTAGDSFTDIYGQRRFDLNTHIKEYVLRQGVPLILGPQTYGPFIETKNRDRALRIVEKAKLVISRDRKSQEYINQYTDKKIHVNTDLAFKLPYKRKSLIDKDKKIKIGINPSGLLISNKTEGTELKVNLSTNYDEFLVDIINAFMADACKEIYIIPHVGNDGVDYLRALFPELNYLGPYQDPITAKNDIATMDVFIGARMHATIAAFSTGVPTIATAYSRKFIGLYENLGYSYVVDLAELTTSEAVEKTLQFVEHKKDLKKAVDEGNKEALLKSNLNYQLLESEIMNILRTK